REIAQRRRWRGHGCGARRGGSHRRTFLCLDRGRRFSRMAGRPRASRSCRINRRIARSREMKASDVMTRDVLTVGRETSVANAIREQILAELAKAAWVPKDGLSISVKDGVVDLNGVILEEKERQALRVVAENVPGVRAVEDNLVWIEPVSGTVVDPPPGERPAR